MSNNNFKQRRDFLRTLVAGSATGALGSLGQLAMMREASAASPVFSDYKAMVCIYLYGGNDSNNMIIPIGTNSLTGYPAYEESRGDLAVANNSLSAGDGLLSSGVGNPYYDDGTLSSAYLKGHYPIDGTELGVNGVMPELAQLINSNKASIMSNIGTLVEPVDRAGILDGTANLPVFLFSHNQQQRALQTGQANNLTDVGWAGKISDSWAGVNNNSDLGLNISYRGNDRMMIGRQSAPLILGTGNPPRFTNMHKDSTDLQSNRRALFKALAGIENTSSTGAVSFDQNSTFKPEGLFTSFLGASSVKSMDVSDVLFDSLDAYSPNYADKDSYDNELFSVPSESQLGFSSALKGSLMAQLSAVSDMIELGANGGFEGNRHNRQIFMVSMGTFDTHNGQDTKHPLLLRELSLALSSFQKALEEKGHANKVTTFTMSDFGRSLGNNGSGTDHAWAGHSIVMGGDGANLSGNFNGGQVLGTSPELVLGGKDDFGSRGRLIPSMAQDQLNATLCRWFGVDDPLMATLFPNLANFGTTPGDIESAYLNTLFNA